jgi:hypothetical protein
MKRIIATTIVLVVSVLFAAARSRRRSLTHRASANS